MEYRECHKKDIITEEALPVAEAVGTQGVLVGHPGSRRRSLSGGSELRSWRRSGLRSSGRTMREQPHPWLQMQSCLLCRLQFLKKVWNSANLGSELGTTVIDPTYARPSNWNPQGEPDPIWPPPAGPIPMVQLEYLNQVHAAVQSAPTSSSSSSSSLLNYPIEPPSNQNYHHSCYRPINAEVVGIKRPHPWTPFSLENPPPPPPLRPRTAHHAGLMNESISLGSGSRSIHDPGSGNFRNEYRNSVSFSASSSAQDSKSTRGSRENGNLGEVLTLAPPSTSSTWPNQRLTDPSPALASKNQNNFHVLEPHHLYQELSDFQQGSTWPGEQQQQHYHNFLAPAISQDAQADTSSKPGNGEHQEPIDLELRL
ncbi:uncharacterized protein LOC116214805 isoform X3 [Punica granatum]|uniref:Uncharacterized protein LOC116214805 isoform X3 n=1 Tax=Punica granatum TaxID=22663 RepID=A0A6P8EHA6_PUNGR|nr:uncharacterized protein LOC116214805 isoform X3 [Punica granatum]XP_031406139.1 uncharacterized protein LOC116214805 isoform X3 [Punica granatum]XP_031406140.1 uncharacterized protein LOC116214805 isoform X3 [Punica granatum]